MLKFRNKSRDNVVMVLNRKGKGFMVYYLLKELKIHEVRNMEEFIKWFLNNWNANIFTLCILRS